MKTARLGTLSQLSLYVQLTSQISFPHQSPLSFPPLCLIILVYLSLNVCCIFVYAFRCVFYLFLR